MISFLQLRIYLKFFFLLTLIQPLQAQNWTQLGQDIDGEVAEDLSGHSVSMNSSGTRVAIGAPGNDGNGFNSGHVRIYEWDGSSWVQLGQDIDGEAVGDLSGHSVSMNSVGTRVAIGAPGNDGNSSDADAGHVRIYEWDGSSWMQLGQDIDGEAAWDSSGWSVSMNSVGTRVAIGAIYNDGNGFNSGHVRIYEWDGSSWVQLGQDIDGEVAQDRSGFSVSMNSVGTRVVIGAPRNDGNGYYAGHVRVYEWGGSSWMQLGSDIDGEAAGDWSGLSVSMNSVGTRVAIGAYTNDGNGSEAGHVRIYEWGGSSWMQLGQDIDGEAAGDWSGHSVSMNSVGTRVVIGAPRNDGNGYYAGHARVYDYSFCPTLDLQVGQQDASCQGVCDGSLTVTGVMNGVAPYIYSWSTGATTDSIGNLCAGSYGVAVTDANNCTVSADYTITEPEALATNATAMDESCNNCNDGMASVAPTGGTVPYSYAWSTGATTATITGLAPGSYTVTVTDGHSCTAEAELSVAEYVCPLLSMFYTAESVVCYGGCDGWVSIDSVVGGTTPYTYTWSTGDSTTEISALCAGAYFVTVTDAKNCAIAQNFTLGEANSLLVNLSTTDVSCTLCEDGTAQANPEGGIPPYQFLWSTGDTTSTLLDLPQGLYALTVTDSLGCVAIDSFEIGVMCTDFPVEVYLQEISCHGLCDGGVEVVVTGQGSYAYSWNTEDSLSVLSDLCSSFYELTITEEQSGCEMMMSFAIEEPAALLLELIGLVHYTDSTLGSIDVELSGGSPPYEYTWTDSLNQIISTEQDVSDLSPGCYDLLVGDSAGCFLDSTFCIADLSVAVHEVEGYGPVSLYPNPVKGVLYLELPKEEFSLAIHPVLISVSGRSVALPDVVHEGGVLWRIAMPEHLPCGMYFLRLSSERFTLTESIYHCR